MTQPIVVVAFGANTPVGRDAWSSAAAVRAGISGITEHPYMIDSVGEPMCVTQAEWLDVKLHGAARFEALLMPAIEPIVEALTETGADRGRILCALGLPNPRPGVPDTVGDMLMQAIERRYPSQFTAVAPFPYGHAAGLLGLEAGIKCLQGGEADACVIAGVDSYLAPETLEWLERCDQLHGGGPLNNAWGLTPGEAAGALLIARADFAKQYGLPVLASILGIGTAHESKRIKTPEVCLGEGLTQAFRLALAAMPDEIQVSDIYCDLNGEPYRADEYGFTCLRTKECFVSPSSFVAPADCWGDVSAAGGPLHLMLATVAGLKQYAQGQLAFVWSSSEDGNRAAVLLATGRRD
jgi:3-oxoacyl-[acyl-carrier-protein] synthase I